MTDQSKTAVPSFCEMLQELDQGYAESALSVALCDVVQAVREIKKDKRVGKVVLTLEAHGQRDLSQIVLVYKIFYAKPTITGKLTEEFIGRWLWPRRSQSRTDD